MEIGPNFRAIFREEFIALKMNIREKFQTFWKIFTRASHSSKLPFSSARTISDLGEDSQQFMKETVTALDLERKKVTLLDRHLFLG